MSRPLILLPLTALTCFSALTACSLDDSDTDELRSVEVRDRWGVYPPTKFPEVNSCEDYWIQRCANLSADQCTLAQARYTCTSAKAGGVVITDTFGELPESLGWEGYSLGDEQRTSVDGGSAPLACETMGMDPERCHALATLADTIAANNNEVFGTYSYGGFARVFVTEDEIMLVGEYPDPEDIVWSAADALDWMMPLAPGEVVLPNPAGIVIEDNVMLLARPNGSLSVSTNEAVFLQSNNWDDCVECDDTIDMPIEEFILIDG